MFPHRRVPSRVSANTCSTWLRSQSSFCHFHAQTCFRRVSATGMLWRPGRPAGTAHGGRHPPPGPAECWCCYRVTGRGHRHPVLVSLRWHRAPCGPGHSCPASTSTPTQGPGVSPALPQLHPVRAQHCPGTQPLCTASSPITPAAPSPGGRVWARLMAGNTIPRCPRCWQHPLPITASPAAPGESLCPGTRGLSSRTRAHGGHPLAAGSPRRRTWMRSRMPSSLSEESTQNTKYSVA